MNWVLENRKALEQLNYVLKADAGSSYWFGVSEKKLYEYQVQFGSNFSIILFGSEDEEGDFYVLPFSAVSDLFVDKNLYLFKGRSKRWVGDIQNHLLRIRNSNIERNIAEFFSLPQERSKVLGLQKDNSNDYAIENAKREVQIRINQSKFRKKVLQNFEYKCCLTGITELDLIVASHIIPWSKKMDTRLSPHNGLCLSILYDTLFDKGFFTIDDSLKVVISSKIEELSPKTQQWLFEIDNKTIAHPKKYEISKESLEFHRHNIFDKIQST